MGPLAGELPAAPAGLVGREGAAAGTGVQERVPYTSHSRLHTRQSTCFSLLVGLQFLGANQLFVPSEGGSPGMSGKPLGPRGPGYLQVQVGLTITEMTGTGKRPAAENALKNGPWSSLVV